MEVRYATKTSLSLKKDVKNLSTGEYTNTLKQYLSDARTHSNLSIADLNRALVALGSDFK